MGREVRMVPQDWEHPKNENGHFIPLHKGPFSERLAQWDEDEAQWGKGMMLDWHHGGYIPIKDQYKGCTFVEWNGERPVQENYMPEFAEGTATHFMMYENTTEGTPLSSAFATPEELARWLADNGASAFGDQTASYEAWLKMIKGEGRAPSAVLTVHEDGSGTMQSGVTALND